MMLEDQYGSLTIWGSRSIQIRRKIDNNAVINNTDLQFRLQAATLTFPLLSRRRASGLKVARNVVVPIITAVLGALAFAIAMHFKRRRC